MFACNNLEPSHYLGLSRILIILVRRLTLFRWMVNTNDLGIYLNSVTD